MTPEELLEGAIAEGKLRLPDPTVTVVPKLRFRDGQAGGVVGMPMWLSISPASWQSQPLKLQAGPVWVDVRAQAVEQVWDFGDGNRVTCRTRGTEYRAGMDPRKGSPDCGYTYKRTSKGKPGGVYTIGVTVYWRITWVGSGDTAGELPLFAVSTSFPYVVKEARAQLVAS